MNVIFSIVEESRNLYREIPDQVRDDSGKKRGNAKHSPFNLFCHAVEERHLWISTFVRMTLYFWIGKEASLFAMTFRKKYAKNQKEEK